jgi:hypothetical protein
VKKNLLALFVILSNVLGLYSQKLPLLKVSENKHYIVTENNEPFFWLGGTAWEMLHRLNKEEVMIYLKDRSSKGFTVIQTVVLAELDGLNTPNAYGHLPLINNDPTKFNEEYFEHVDYIIQQAQNLGLYIGLLPTWGDKFNRKWGIGPEIFTPENAEIYGELLARRYLGQNNIIWILGGDRLPENDNQSDIIRSMAKGIRKADTLHLITYHPWGGKRAAEVFNEEWLDLDMFQSGHTRLSKEYEYVEAGRKVIPYRPVINGESRYENIPDRFWQEGVYGWLDDSDVRTSAYWSMLAGAAGYTYGCNDIWQMYSIDKRPEINARTGWAEAIHLPGSRHMKYMKELLVSFPWQEMINDQSIILNENPQDSGYIICATGNKKDFIIAYTPMGRAVKSDISRINAQKVKAYWYNPRSGKSIKTGEYSTTDTPEFKPWSTGRGSDFILVILDINSNYKLPE